MKQAIGVTMMLLSGVLAGCGGSYSGPVEQPVAMQSAGGDLRNRARVHTELGMAYLREGQFNVALDEGKVSLAIDASYPLVYNLLGLVYMNLKENARAEENFEQALRLAPGDPEINDNIGWFYCQTGREQRAFNHFEISAKNPLYATPARPLTHAGMCALRLKDAKRAEDFLNRALRADPSSPDALFLLADALYQQGRHAEARLRITAVHRLTEPTAATAWLALRIERKTGDREAEMRWATQLRRKFADSQEYRKLNQGLYE